MTDTTTIPASPGFVGDTTYPNELAADVSVELTYAPSGPSTKASLILTATDIEGGRASLTVGVELTKGDIRLLADVASSMLAAIDEDEEDDNF